MKIKENLWGINERAMKINEKLMRSMKIQCKFNANAMQCQSKFNANSLQI